MDSLRRLEQAIAPHLDRILTPALIIDLDAVEHNVDAMIQRVGDRSRWRPHIKTVKQSVILRILLDRGIRQFKVATTDELDLLVDTAADDATSIEVLLAYPASGPSLARAISLARRSPGAVIQLLADSPAHARTIADAVPLDRRPWPVFLDVNLGMNRTGSTPETWLSAVDRVDAIEGIRVEGLHGYDGHWSWDERDAAHRAYERLIELARAYDVAQLITSGTHSYAHALAHEGLAAGPWRHQVSAGTVILSDLRSAPAAEDLGLRQAAFVASRVVSAPLPDRLTLDAGSKGIAPDRPAPGLSVLGHPELTGLRRSEEHLPVAIAGETTLAPGDLAFLIPEHVCTTVNLYREALWLRGDELAGSGPVEAMSRRTWLDDGARP